MLESKSLESPINYNEESCGNSIELDKSLGHLNLAEIKEEEEEEIYYDSIQKEDETINANFLRKKFVEEEVFSEILAAGAEWRSASPPMTPGMHAFL